MSTLSIQRGRVIHADCEAKITDISEQLKKEARKNANASFSPDQVAKKALELVHTGAAEYKESMKKVYANSSADLNLFTALYEDGLLHRFYNFTFRGELEEILQGKKTSSEDTSPLRDSRYKC